MDQLLKSAYRITAARHVMRDAQAGTVAGDTARAEMDAARVEYYGRVDVMGPA